MPTAAKLFGALAFAILGWFSANMFSTGLPEGSQIGLLREIVAAIGFLAGWRVMGPAAGRGYYAALGGGVKTGIVMVFFSLLGFSIYEMVLLSMKMRYDGPLEAVLGVFDLMIEYGNLLLRTDLLVTLFVGSALGGWISEFAGKHWR
jgi:hypothetical protein